MMQQQQIQQEEMLMKQQIEKQNQSFTVSFRFEGESKNVYNIQCRMKDKISDVIERYRNKSSDRRQTKKFVFNAKVLNSDQTVEEAGLSNNSVIYVIETDGVRVG